MSVAIPPLSALPPPYPVVRFSVDDYHRLSDVGLLGENERIELLEGCLVPKTTHSPLHADTIESLSELLQRVLPPGWRVRVQLPITTSDSEPEPDLAVVRRTRRTSGHPTAPDLALTIEVSDSTLTQDLHDKARLYARAEIVEYWVVNLRDRRLEVFRQPSGPISEPCYRQSLVFQPGQTVELRLDGAMAVALNVSDLLP
ncbi:MAG: Uma2 family endonuclease [Planctomycetota bacterium]